MLIFFADCIHLLTRNREKKFEDMFLVKIENKGTTLRVKIIGNGEIIETRGSQSCNTLDFTVPL